MQKQQVIGTIALCILFSLPGIGCVRSSPLPPLKQVSGPVVSVEPETPPIDDSQQKPEEDTFSLSSSSSSSPSGKQDLSSLIVTGTYEGNDDRKNRSFAYIQKTNHDRYPFTLKIFHDDREWNPTCYQEKNTLICAYDDADKENIIIKQISNTEIEVSDNGFSRAMMGAKYRLLPTPMHRLK